MTSLCAGVLILGTVPLVYDNIESSTSRTGINGAIKNSVAQALTALAKSNIYYSKSVSATMERNYFVDSQIQVTQQGNTTSLRVSY